MSRDDDDRDRPRQRDDDEDRDQRRRRDEDAPEERRPPRRADDRGEDDRGRRRPRRDDDDDEDYRRSRRDDDDDEDYRRWRREREGDYDDDYRRRSDIGQDAGMRMLLPVGRSGWAIAAGYLGLFSLLCVPAPLALLCGILAVLEMKRDRKKHGMGRAVFGIIMGSLGTVFLAIMLFGVLTGKFK